MFLCISFLVYDVHPFTYPTDITAMFTKPTCQGANIELTRIEMDLK